MRSRSLQPIEERLWRRVDKSGGPNACWPWTGGKNSAGYGLIGNGGHEGKNRMVLCHHVAWESKHGPLPKGKIVRHYKCDNPPCCNPAHLRKGTYRDNSRDMMRKDRHARAGGGPLGSLNGQSKLNALKVWRLRLTRLQRRCTLCPSP